MKLHAMADNAVMTSGFYHGASGAYHVAAREIENLLWEGAALPADELTARLLVLAEQFRLYTRERQEAAREIDAKMDAAAALLALSQPE